MSSLDIAPTAVAAMPDAPPAFGTPATSATPGSPLFRSFWMGGYEGADHVNSRGAETAVNVATGHWARLDEDYRLLGALGIRTIRESIGWRASVDRHGRLDTARLVAMAACARRHGLEVVWTIHHYGVPDGVDFLAADFP